MYWNNSWLNNFNDSYFLNKTLFLSNFFTYLFSERVFSFFFLSTCEKESKFFKDTRALTRGKPKNKVVRYNFTKLWVVQYNDFILLSNFCFFYFKIKGPSKGLKKKNLFKTATVFFKKKRSANIKKKQFFLKEYYNF